MRLHDSEDEVERIEDENEEEDDRVHEESMNLSNRSGSLDLEKMDNPVESFFRGVEHTFNEELAKSKKINIDAKAEF